MGLPGAQVFGFLDKFLTEELRMAVVASTSQSLLPHSAAQFTSQLPRRIRFWNPSDFVFKPKLPKTGEARSTSGIEQEEYYQNCSLGFRLQVLYSLTHPERVTVAVVAVVTATGVVVAFLVVVAGGSSRTVVVAVVETIITSRKAKRIRNNWVLVKELNLSYHNKEIR